MTPCAADIALAVRSGAKSALEGVETTLQEIAAGDVTLNAFTAVYAERARAEARAVDRARAEGGPLGPLCGVPYCVKNLFDVEGEVTLAGAHVNRARPQAERDATLVARMRAAGAILVGAVNMDEHAYGFTTENSHFGATRNPLDATRTAGGSSGGSGAAVGAGLVPLSLGSDTNGSIRVPASFCGVFGLKPTFGRLPRTGSFPFVHSLDHLGPLGRSVDDLALCYDALQGFDATDAACVERPVEPTRATLGEPVALRVAVLGGYFHEWAGAEARRAVALAAEALDASHEVVWPSAAQARAAAFVVTGSEGGALHARRLAELYDDYEPLSRDRLLAGSLIPARWLLAAQKWRALCRADVLRLFDEVDVLLAPATPTVAPPLGTEWIDLNGERLAARPTLGLLAQPISSMGLPVCAVPVWPDGANALPVGVQVIAAPWREDRCLAVAARLEALGVARCAGVKPC